MRRNEQDTVRQNTKHFVLFVAQRIVTIHLGVNSQIVLILNLVYDMRVAADIGEKSSIVK